MELLTVKQASGIVDSALEKAREINCKPMTVAVLDAGGHLLSFKREDGSSIMRPQIAMQRPRALWEWELGAVPLRLELRATQLSSPL
jgi:uncharacterized protein GlcG (DUF336 family)